MVLRAGTSRACILDLLRKNAASLGTLGDGEPGKVISRLSRSDAELPRRSHLALQNSKMKPYPDPLRSYTSLIAESVRQAALVYNQNYATCYSYTWN